MPFADRRARKKAAQTISFALAILGLAGLADDVVKWRAFFEFGILSHYVEVRNWILSFLPLRIPAWAADYVTIGAALAYPMKEITNDAERNIERLELEKIKLSNKITCGRQESERYSDENKKDIGSFSEQRAAMHSIRREFGYNPRELTEKARLRFDKEVANCERQKRETEPVWQKSLFLKEQVDNMEKEFRSYSERIAALKGLLLYYRYTKYLILFLWPLAIFVLMTFMTGIISGFDRAIISKFMLSLARIFLYTLIVMFIVVDIRRTIAREQRGVLSSHTSFRYEVSDVARCHVAILHLINPRQSNSCVAIHPK